MQSIPRSHLLTVLHLTTLWRCGFSGAKWAAFKSKSRSRKWWDIKHNKKNFQASAWTIEVVFSRVQVEGTLWDGFGKAEFLACAPRVASCLFCSHPVLQRTRAQSTSQFSWGIFFPMPHKWFSVTQLIVTHWAQYSSPHRSVLQKTCFINPTLLQELLGLPSGPYTAVWF